MSYVIYNVLDTRIARHPKTNREYYKSLPAAKAALTVMLDKGMLNSDDFYAIANAVEFAKHIEKTKKVRNLMSGTIIEIPVNTPRCCDPSTELYWSC